VALLSNSFQEASYSLDCDDLFHNLATTTSEDLVKVARGTLGAKHRIIATEDIESYIATTNSILAVPRNRISRELGKAELLEELLVMCGAIFLRSSSSDKQGRNQEIRAGDT
jgi:hypothetical protein